MITLFLPIDFSAISAEHLALAISCYVIVFLSLFLLSLVFGFLPKLRTRKLRKKLQQGGGVVNASIAGKMVPGEVSAAVALAISMYFEELHDQETSILTIKKVGKSYSPWNSKIYNVTNLNRFQR
jgi:glutaconyl-CoA/methylmalonyl-CoA decarboxylase subunit delta